MHWGDWEDHYLMLVRSTDDRIHLLVDELGEDTGLTMCADGRGDWYPIDRLSGELSQLRDLCPDCVRDLADLASDR